MDGGVTAQFSPQLGAFRRSSRAGDGVDEPSLRRPGRPESLPPSEPNCLSPPSRLRALGRGVGSVDGATALSEKRAPHHSTIYIPQVSVPG
jgi:hypothetical protein